MTNSKHILSAKTETFDLSYEGRLGLPALIRYFQQAAHEHASILGVGYHHLKPHNIFWVLSTLTVEIEDLPLFDEPFEVETWPVGVSGLLTSRDFIAYKDGNVIVRASTQWLMVSMENKRPVRPEAWLSELPFLAGENALESPYTRIRMPEDKQLLEERRVRYSDLDINRHVNNVRYFEWMLDMLNDSEFSSRNIASFSLQYSGEFLKDETAKINMHRHSDDSVFIEIAHQVNKKGILCKINFA